MLTDGKSMTATRVPNGLLRRCLDLEGAFEGIEDSKAVHEVSLFRIVEDRQDAYKHGYCWDTS